MLNEWTKLLLFLDVISITSTLNEIFKDVLETNPTQRME